MAKCVDNCLQVGVCSYKMVKGKKVRVGRSSNGRRGDDTCLVPFDTVVAGSIAAGATNVINLTPAGLGTRCAANGDLYQNYNLEWVKFVLEPLNASTATIANPDYFAAGLLLNQSDNASTLTASEVVQQKHHVVQVGTKTIPVKFSVRHAELYRDKVFKAYKTIAGAADDLEEIESQIVLAHTASTGVSFVAHVSGAMRFASPVVPGATPAPEKVPRAVEKRFENVENMLTQLASNPLLQQFGSLSPPPRG